MHCLGFVGTMTFHNIECLSARKHVTDMNRNLEPVYGHKIGHRWVYWPSLCQ